MKITWIFLMVFPHIILSIVFTQSGFDKLFDWNGNLTWIRSHFAKSPLGPFSKLLLVVLSFLETLGGVLGLLGSCLTLFTGFQELATAFLEMSLVLLACALIGLMVGQRMAKDYAGAASLTGYCILLTLSFLMLFYPTNVDLTIW